MNSKTALKQPDTDKLESNCISSYSTQNISSVLNYYWQNTNQNYLISGIYFDTLTNMLGCDSIVTLNLTITEPTITYEFIEPLCTNSPLFFEYTGTPANSVEWDFIFGGSIIGQNGTSGYLSNVPVGTFDFSLTLNFNGVDTIIFYEDAFTVNNINSVSVSHSTCQSYEWNDSIYTTSGNYSAIFTNQYGCDSIVYLDLTIHNNPIMFVSNNGNGNLTASTSTYYQWFDCITNSPISGANSQVFLIPVNGEYAVIGTSAFGCSDTSNCILIDDLSTFEHNSLKVQIYPNPSNGEFLIKAKTTLREVNVYSQTGTFVRTIKVEESDTTEININGLQTGVYLLELVNDTEKSWKKVIVN
jgi:hypothetical protein